MPRPDLNIISWSYGCLIIAGIFGTVAAICLYYEVTIMRGLPLRSIYVTLDTIYLPSPSPHLNLHTLLQLHQLLIHIYTPIHSSNYTTLFIPPIFSTYTPPYTPISTLHYPLPTTLPTHPQHTPNTPPTHPQHTHNTPPIHPQHTHNTPQRPQYTPNTPPTTQYTPTHP